MALSHILQTQAINRNAGTVYHPLSWNSGFYSTKTPTMIERGGKEGRENWESCQLLYTETVMDVQVTRKKHITT